VPSWTLCADPSRRNNDLFGETPLPADQQIEFYQHEVGWANRLILGDSLLVMNSLLVKEGMAGKVQMIYIDPPYGIKYASNFQPRIDRRDVKDKDEDLTHEPEQIKAYRDTWTLGIHSYLTYLRDRLLLARELLTESGSIFVQINDENLHLVRCLLDEVFGRENFVHRALHPDDHRPGRPGLRPHLRLRHHGLLRREVGTAVDYLRHQPRGPGHRPPAADDGKVRLLRARDPERGPAGGFIYETVPHITLESPLPRTPRSMPSPPNTSRRLTRRWPSSTGRWAEPRWNTKNGRL
jgi:hypothetical protein